MVVALRRYPLRAGFGRAPVWFYFAGVPWIAGAFVAGWARLALRILALVVDYAAVPLHRACPR
jgi:low temperature requirement protein LtrA